MLTETVSSERDDHCVLINNTAELKSRPL